LPRHKERVAFQGERGAFSEIAARRLLGDEIDFVPCERFEQVFRALADGAATASVIPIENTLHGSIHENYDHLLNFDLKIVAETNIRIVHNLIAPPGTRLRDVRRVYSHPVALNQCLNFFAGHPELERVTFYDTAGSVKMVMADRPAGAAAIASAVAAETYGATILKKSIEDDRQNFTRFFLLRRPDYAQAPVKREPKITLIFTTPNQPGSLFRALAAFSLRDISITKIESRPMRGRPWEYLFYVDVLGHVKEERVQRALAHVHELSEISRVFGCYEAFHESQRRPS
jgi:prephenate dehydratase